MDLQAVFPNNPVCLLIDTLKEKTWRIMNVSIQALNYFRIWLVTQLLSVAIDWIEISINTSSYYNEYLAHRLGLIPITTSPLLLQTLASEERNPQLCTEETCIIFDLNVWHVGPGVRNVVSGDLRWIPLGRQLEKFVNSPPRPVSNDILIAKLLHGQEIHLRCYAIRGTPQEHAKWSSTNVYYRLIPTGLPISVTLPEFTTPGIPPLGVSAMSLPGSSIHASILKMRPGIPKSTIINPQLPLKDICQPCDQLPINIKMQQGFNCYHFTIELIGGLTFEEIQKQIETRFSWS